MKTLSPDLRRTIQSQVVRPVPLVVMSYRADEGTRKLYLSDRDYRHGGHLYLGLIAQKGISDISYSLRELAGIAEKSSLRLSIVNAAPNPDRPLSALLQDYTLLHHDLTLDYIFEPGTEKTRLFTGQIEEISIGKKSIDLTVLSTNLGQIRSVPTHIATFSEHPNIPLSNADQPFPVVFGNLNTPPAENRYTEQVILAPCLLLDTLTRKYTAGDRASFYGDAYTFDSESETFSRLTGTSRDISLTSGGNPFTLSGSTSKKVLQSVTGYRDAAANYADGGVVNAADTVLSSPLDCAHALLRDKKIGMGMPTAQVDRSTIAQDRAKMPAGYRFDFSMNEAHDFDAFSELLAHGLLRMWASETGAWKVRPATDFDRIDARFTPWNIHADSFRLKKKSEKIFNHFFLRYGWSEALGMFTKSLIRSPYTKRQGTGTLAAHTGGFGAGRLEVESAESDPVIAEDRAWIAGEYYTVTLAVGNFVYLNREDGRPIQAREDALYYIGTNFDYRCWQSAQRYGIEQSYKGHESQAIESKYIQDDSTARAFLDALIQYYGQAEDIATFQTGIGAVALDPGDVISIDHPLLGPADAARGALNQAISWPDTAFGITHPTAGGLGAGDVIVLEDADTGAFEMIRITSASGGRVTACERGYGNGIPRRWGSGHAFARVRKKWQITDIGLNVTAAEATITARSVRA